MIEYPIGYGSRLVPLKELEAFHGPRMHPEYRRRLFAWLPTLDGRIGIGGGYRPPGGQPVAGGFAPEGKSFHQDQMFASGTVAFCAVDLVHRVDGDVHRSPTWAETETAPAYGLHTFIYGEPWHLQPLEIRGWQAWINDGRPDPTVFDLPGGTVQLDRSVMYDPPTRLLDTRNTDRPASAGEHYVVDLGLADVPTAVIANLTVVDPSQAGYVAAYGDHRGEHSNVNYYAARTVANLAVIPVREDGTFTIYTTSATHLIVDLMLRLD